MNSIIIKEISLALLELQLQQEQAYFAALAESTLFPEKHPLCKAVKAKITVIEKQIEEIKESII